jgi:MFS family permease
MSAGVTPQPGTKRRWTIPALLREQTFRRFWIGQTVSLFGDQVSLLAIPLTAVLVLHADAAQMGYLTAAGTLPSLLFSLPAGARIDRSGRRRQIMLTTDVLRAAFLLTIPAAYLAGLLVLAHLYVVTFAVGTLDVLFFVSYTTLFVAIVPPDQYVEGNSLLNGSRALSFVGGQSLAGLLVAAFTAPGALILDALSFLGSALALSRIRPTEPAATPAEDATLRAGVRFIRRSAIVRAALGATATVNFFTFVFTAIFILYATRNLHIRPAELGLVLGAGAIGGLIGATVTGPISRRLGIGPAFVLSCLLFPAPLLLVPLAPDSHVPALSLLFLAEFGSGIGVMILDISAGSIFAAVIPDHLRARVSGAYRTINYGVRPLGAVTGGLLGHAIGLHPTLWIATLGAVLSIIWTLPGSLRHLHTLPTADPPDDLIDNWDGQGLREAGQSML